MITDIEDYFAKGCGRCDRFATPDCSTRRWLPGLESLRGICLDVGLSETVKWGQPCYTYSGRNIAIIGAFRNDFRICFFNAALLKDTKRILEKPGPNTRYAEMIRFLDSAQVSTVAPTLRAYLQEAMHYAAAGVTAPRVDEKLVLPEELQEALIADEALAEAFDSLTPGRQRSYVINLQSAKKPATRYARITRFRDKILSGKGAMER